MMDVYLSGLSKTYRGVTIINNINLFLSGGSFNILSGLNGSGKTTLIEIIAGITQPSNGNIFIGGTKVNNLPPFKRKVFYIPQTPHKYWQLIDQRLYCFIPNMTIKENLIEAMNSSGVILKIDDLVDSFDLKDYLNDTPNHLSYGLQQRLALARAFLAESNIILMDEPLSAIDTKMKPRLIEIIKWAYRCYGKTVLYVTHDIEEAKMYNGINYMIMDGRIQKQSKTHSISYIKQQKKEINNWLSIDFCEKEENQLKENLHQKKNDVSNNFRERDITRIEQASKDIKSLSFQNETINPEKPSDIQEASPNQFLKFSQQLEKLEKSSQEMLKTNKEIFKQMNEMIEEIWSNRSEKKQLSHVKTNKDTLSTIKEAADFTNFKAPLYIAWETTHRCNATCIHCYTNSGPDVNCDNELSTEKALDVIDQLADSGLMVLAFSGGEPMLRKDWLILAEHAKKHGLAVNIGTNGSSINTQTANELKEVGVHSVTVSLDSHIPEIHDRIRQKEGLFWQAIKAILLLVDRGVRVVVGFTPTKLNLKDGGYVIQLAHQLGANAVNLSNYVPAGRGSISIDLRAEELRRILEEWIEYRQKYKGQLEVIWHDCRVSLIVPEHEKRDYLGCGAGRFVARILPDGTVTPCFFLPIPIGSMRTNNFQEIWQDSKILRQFRERSGHISGNCKECEHLQICGGCRSVAYAYSNKDPLAGDPHCWIVPDDTSYMEALAEGAGLPY